MAASCESGLDLDLDLVPCGLVNNVGLLIEVAHRYRRNLESE